MARRALTAVAVAFGLLVPSAVMAQTEEGFGQGNPFVVSVEHLGGVSYRRIKPEGGEASTYLQAGVFTPALSPSTPLARLGLHYFVAPSISVGGLFNYIDNDIFGTTYLIGARFGYAAALSPSTAVWARAGVSYSETEISLFGSSTISAILPGGELLLVFHPTENFGIFLGPMFEISVGGKQEVEVTNFVTGAKETQERDLSFIEAALTFGVLADF